MQVSMKNTFLNGQNKREMRLVDFYDYMTDLDWSSIHSDAEALQLKKYHNEELIPLWGYLKDCYSNIDMENIGLTLCGTNAPHYDVLLCQNKVFRERIQITCAIHPESTSIIRQMEKTEQKNRQAGLSAFTPSRNCLADLRKPAESAYDKTLSKKEQKRHNSDTKNQACKPEMRESTTIRQEQIDLIKAAIEKKINKPVEGAGINSRILLVAYYEDDKACYSDFDNFIPEEINALQSFCNDYSSSLSKHSFYRVVIVNACAMTMKDAYEANNSTPLSATEIFSSSTQSGT